MKPQEKKIAVAVAAVVGFMLLEYALFHYADRWIAVWAGQADLSHHAVIDFFRAYTDLGKAVWYLVPCGLATLFCAFLSRAKDVPARWRLVFSYVGARAFFLFATIALSGIAADILKPIFGRARPVLWLRDEVYGFAPFNTGGFLWNGMPSGHTTTAFALACSLSFLYPRLRIGWFAYALFLGASRVMVDAHYLSDVVAGAALGWLTAWLFTRYGIILVRKVIFPIDSETLRS